MSVPKHLFLTTVTTKVNEKGLERVKKINKKVREEDEDSPPKEGTKRWFENMNIPVPKHLEENEIEEEVPQDGLVHLKEDEYEYIHNEYILERCQFEGAEDTEDGLTIVFTKSGREIEVLEDTSVIFEQIYMLDQTIFEKWYDIVKWKIKGIFKKEKHLILEVSDED